MNQSSKHPVAALVVVLLVSLCAASALAAGPVVVKKPAVEASPEKAPLDPGAALIDREREVWSLEGLLVSEADAALRAPGAKAALGDVAKLGKSADGEAKVRAYLRGVRSAEARALATQFLDALDGPSRALVDQAAKDGSTTAADVVMDYLTYDGLLDLTAMRLSYQRWKAGKSGGDTKRLADSFFAASAGAPSAKLGIAVRSASERLIEVDVFGCRITEAVHTSGLKTVGAKVRGLVTWSSNYEQLRQALRGARVEEKHTEELEPDGPTFRLDYQRELTEYLAAAAVRPWALELYAVPADELADLNAGPAAAAGVEHDAAKPAVPGWVGGAKGLRFEVMSAKASQGSLVVVTVKMTSKLPSELRVPGGWFHLRAGGVRYEEVGLRRAAFAGKGTPTLELPFARLGKKPLTAALVFDVPAGTKELKLEVGDAELTLPVALR
jgi:hypothetical protein